MVRSHRLQILSIQYSLLGFTLFAKLIDEREAKRKEAKT